MNLNREKTAAPRQCTVACIVLLAGSVWTAPAASATDSAQANFAIASQALESALIEFTRLTDMQLLYTPELVRNRRANAVSGSLSAAAALERLLDGTGVTATRVGEDTFSLRAESASPRSEALGEVLVTARKREERLQDVPASIATASGELVGDLALQSVTELDTIAPGLTFATNPSRFGSGPTIALRGISTQAQTLAIQDSVGFVVDGVPVLRSKAAAFPDLADVERVEVLRGPQGTLFGMNASAGVISIVTRDPTFEPQAGAALSTGRYDSRAGNATISGPVGEALRGHLVVSARKRDGFVRNVFDDSLWERDEQLGARGKFILGRPGDATLRLTADYVRQRNDAGTNVPREFTAVTPAYVRTSLAGIIGLENDRIDTKSVGENRQASGGLALQADLPIADHTLTAIAAYRRYSQDAHVGTYTWLTPLNDGEQFYTQDAEQYSTEIRIASPDDRRIDLVAGLFFLKQLGDSTLEDPATLNLPQNTRSARNVVTAADTTNYAIFAEANMDITSGLALTAGLRATRETVDAMVIGLPIAPGLARFGPPLGRSDDSATVERASWRLGAQWRPAADVMLYVSGASGFKGPAFNTNPSRLGDLEEARPEVATSYELGFKSQFLDRRLSLNATAFHASYDDFQAQGGLFLPGSTATQIVILNAGKLRTRGMEAEASWSAGRATQLIANGAWVDAQFLEFRNAPCYPGQALVNAGCATSGLQDLSGSRMPNSPKLQLNLIGRQGFAVPRTDWSGMFAVSYSLRSSVQWHSLGSPQGVEDGYGLLGASLALSTRDEKFTLRLSGKNLTDRFYTSGISVGQVVTHFLPADYRRTYGVEVSLRL